MNLKPILFSTPMVAATLDESKSQTRRIMKDQPIIDEDSGYVFVFGKQFDIHDWKSRVIHEHCPYGLIGDCLWVRETWKIAGWLWDDYEMKIEFKDGATYWTEIYDPSGTNDVDWLLKYIETMESKGVIKVPDDYDIDKDGEEFQYERVKEYPWKPSIHQPRVASRIMLRITNVRIERLHDITEDDAMAEGISSIRRTSGICYMDYRINEHVYPMSPVKSFETLWDSINGDCKKDGSDHSWKTNPSVWVVDYRIEEVKARNYEQ